MGIFSSTLDKLTVGQSSKSIINGSRCLKITSKVAMDKILELLCSTNTSQILSLFVNSMSNVVEGLIFLKRFSHNTL